MPGLRYVCWRQNHEDLVYRSVVVIVDYYLTVVESGRIKNKMRHEPPVPWERSRRSRTRPGGSSRGTRRNWILRDRTRTHAYRYTHIHTHRPVTWSHRFGSTYPIDWKGHSADAPGTSCKTQFTTLMTRRSRFPLPPSCTHFRVPSRRVWRFERLRRNCALRARDVYFTVAGYVCNST